MKCSQCNQEILDNSRFCSFCSAPVNVPADENTDTIDKNIHKLCPGCRKVFSTDRVYCDCCGRLLRLRKIEGKKLIKLSTLSKYESTSSFSLSKPTGDIILFDDHIEFIQKAENAAVAFLDSTGIRTSTKKAPVIETYTMDEIASAHATNQVGLCPALVIQLKDQRTISFRRLTDSNMIYKAAELIEEYRT